MHTPTPPTPPTPPSEPLSPSSKQPAPLPRATTFRQSRPASTGPAGLRRGAATFVNRPLSQNASRLPEGPPNIPRLRRGSTFRELPSKQQPADDGKPQLRRGSYRMSAVNPQRASFRSTNADSAARTPNMNSPSRLPRAGTFAYGAQQRPKAVDFGSEDASVRRMSSGEKRILEKRCCGMCSSCGTGLKGMPPWAPERLKLLSEQERETVLMELHQKEEMGKLEAELRRKRIADRNAVAEQIQNRLSRHVSANDASFSSDSNTEDSKRISLEEQELESVDLGAEVFDSKSSTSVSVSDCAQSNDTFKMHSAMKRERSVIDDECQECDDMEGKVKDLEEQLDVLREVVNMCSQNEEASKRESNAEKKGKSWMGKITSAYYGSSLAASERNRLKGEVEALRKATDFLFQKLQTSGS